MAALPSKKVKKQKKKKSFHEIITISDYGSVFGSEETTSIHHATLSPPTIPPRTETFATLSESVDVSRDNKEESEMLPEDPEMKDDETNERNNPNSSVLEHYSHPLFDFCHFTVASQGSFDVVMADLGISEQDLKRCGLKMDDSALIWYWSPPNDATTFCMKRLCQSGKVRQLTAIIHHELEQYYSALVRLLIELNSQTRVERIDLVVPDVAIKTTIVGWMCKMLAVRNCHYNVNGALVWKTPCVLNCNPSSKKRNSNFF
jgi:hypothetical protein